MKLRVYRLLGIIIAVVWACLLGSVESLAQNAYITNIRADTVSVLNTASNTVTATIPVGFFPTGVAVSPDGRTVYVANENSGTVSVIDTATNTVSATIPVGNEPFGVAVSPNGRMVYVANEYSDSVSVIDTANNTVTAPSSWRLALAGEVA
jgi:YVTN family beta-propeller protein